MCRDKRRFGNDKPQSTPKTLARSSIQTPPTSQHRRDSSPNLHPEEEPGSQPNGRKSAIFAAFFESLKKIFILLSPVRPGIACQEQRNCISDSQNCHTAASGKTMDNSRLEIDFGTSRLKKPSSVTVPVNGQRVQSLRQSAGMTQEELAKKAGYSDRLVRKAEASSPLRKSTIADLADALSTATQKVTADDLVFSRELISRDVASFILNGSLSPPDALSDLIHPRFVLRAAGQDMGIPFAGDVKGASACQSFRDRLNAAFSVVHFLPEQTRCFVATHETCVQATTLMMSCSPPQFVESAVEIWWFLKARFEASRLLSIELHYDTGNICRLLGRF